MVNDCYCLWQRPLAVKDGSLELYTPNTREGHRCVSWDGVSDVRRANKQHLRQVKGYILAAAAVVMMDGPPLRTMKLAIVGTHLQSSSMLS